MSGDYTHQVLIDWDNNGFLNAYSDVTAYLLDGSVKIGFSDILKSPVAQVGSATLRLRNESRLFSPLNSSGPLFGKLDPNTPIAIKSTVSGTQYTLFAGYVKRIAPRSGSTQSRDVVFECQDMLGRLQQFKLDFPLQLNKTGDAIVAGIVSTALGNAANTLTVTFAGTPTAGHTLILALPNGTTTITYAASAPGPGQMLANSAAQGAASLIALINKTDTTGTLYGTTQLSDDCTAASGGGNTVVITSQVSGTKACAAFTATSNDSNVTLSNSGVATGGADTWSLGSLVADTGINVLPIAAQNWSGSATSALSAIEQVTRSENGLFFQRNGGNLQWWNRNHIFTSLVGTVVSAGINTPDIIGDMGSASLYNIVKTVARPHSTLAPGVVAKITASTQVPGNGSTVVHLPFIDPVSQQKMGAQNLILPLVATTDWVANEQKDGSGVDYTTAVTGYVTFSYLISASGIDITVKNTASGPLYLNKLQVRGTGIVTYNPVTTTAQDTAGNLALYGANTLTMNYDLSEDLNYAQASAAYLLNRWKAPAYRVTALDYKAQVNSGGTPNVPVLLLYINSSVTVTDTQLGLSAGKYLVIGADFSLKPQEINAMLHVAALDDQTYWILGDATYGVLGSTTRLAV